LKDINGEAYVAVCKALVTKASVFIPDLSSYIIALSKIMKQRGEHETISMHLHRIMTDFLYNPGGIPTDESRLIRADNFELNPEVQKEVGTLLALINSDNFTDPEVADFAGFRKEFMQNNGFEMEGVNYDIPYP
jgi:enoyl-[acyl-carrier protein] reductase/trans-2-enoyl-CoA reductase (NAD+)